MKKALSILLVVLGVFCVSCRKDKLITDSKAKLSFSRDSILFDTVFTQIGSTTKLFTVHNKNSGKINISSVRLARGGSSFYRLNVDGQSGTPDHVFTDIEIAAHDSIYIFVEVTINPNFDPSVSPFIYRDSILFETNGNVQDVDCIAFGQNAYYHFPTQKYIIDPTHALFYDTLHVPSGGTETWATDKPHLIYGWVVVDSMNKTLVIPQDAKIYIHQNGGIWVYNTSSLQVNGTHGHEVVFQGDRLEPEYKDVPGQWDRIWINQGGHNVINYAIIKNSFIGIQAENSVFVGLGGSTLPASPTGTVSLSNTIIQNCSHAGILARYFNITGGNDVVSNCGNYLCKFEYGGNYSFKQCTFANYWAQTNNSGGAQTRTTPSFYFNNYVSGVDLAFDSLWFGNCLMGGNLNEEFQFDTTATPGKLGKMMFDHCAMATQMNTSNTNHFNTVRIWAPSFVDYSSYNFHLNNNSAAIGQGANTSSAQGNWFTDIEGSFRNSPPDLGAYKF